MKIEIEVDDSLKLDGFELVRVGVPAKGDWVRCYANDPPVLAREDYGSLVAAIYRKLPPPKQYRDPTNEDIGKPCEVKFGSEWKPAIYCGSACGWSVGVWIVLYPGGQQVSHSLTPVRIEVPNEDN